MLYNGDIQNNLLFRVRVYGFPAYLFGHDLLALKDKSGNWSVAYAGIEKMRERLNPCLYWTYFFCTKRLRRKFFFINSSGEAIEKIQKMYKEAIIFNSQQWIISDIQYSQLIKKVNELSREELRHFHVCGKRCGKNEEGNCMDVLDDLLEKMNLDKSVGQGGRNDLMNLIRRQQYKSRPSI